MLVKTKGGQTARFKAQRHMLPNAVNKNQMPGKAMSNRSSLFASNMHKRKDRKKLEAPLAQALLGTVEPGSKLRSI